MKIFFKDHNGVLSFLKERPEFEAAPLHEAEALALWQDVIGDGLSFARLARGQGIPSLVVQHGHLATKDYAPPSEDHPASYPLTADRICVWGAADRRRALSAGIAAERVVVTGCPLLDELPARTGGGAEPNILFLPAHWDCDMPENEEVLARLLDVPGVRITVKLIREGHRVERFQAAIEGKNARLVVTGANEPGHIEALKDALAGADAAVSLREGTAELIACAMDVPLVLIDAFRPRPFLGRESYAGLKNAQSGGALWVEKDGDLAGAVRLLLDRPETLRAERRRVAEENGGLNLGPGAKDRIAKAIADLRGAGAPRVEVRSRTKVLMVYTDWGQRNGAYGACGYYRVVQPARWMNRLYGDRWRVDATGELQVSFRAADVWTRLFRAYDLLVFQHVDVPEAIAAIFAARRLCRKPVLLDFDDDFFHVDPLSPSYREYHPGSAHEHFTRQTLRWADAVLVSTPGLREAYRKDNPDVRVCPNFVDPEEWRGVERPRAEDGFVRIGWCGSVTHESDLQTVAGPLRRLLERRRDLRFVAGGYNALAFDALPRDRFEYRPGVNWYEDYPDYLARLDYDIGIAPLKNNAFNRGKSAIKHFEHAMLGVPMVMSAGHGLPYPKTVRDGETGFLARGDADWICGLERLADDPALRRSMGEAARRDVSERFSAERWIGRWTEAFEAALERGVQSRPGLAAG